jgi:hypothetical protein
LNGAAWKLVSTTLGFFRGVPEIVLLLRTCDPGFTTNLAAADHLC